MSNLFDMHPTKEARHFCAGPFTCHARFSTRADARTRQPFTSSPARPFSMSAMVSLTP